MYIENKTLSVIYKIIILIGGIAGVLIQMGVFAGKFSFGCFRYFTVLSNFAAILYFSMALIFLSKASAGKENTTFCPILKGIITMGLTVTFLVAHFLLSRYSSGGTMGISLKLLHYIVPIMTILDWILFDQKGQIKRYAPLIWLIMPLIYLLYAMFAAHIGNGIGVNSRYPYPFLDVDKLGVETVAITVALLTVGFLAMGYVYYLIDFLLSKIKARNI